LLKQTNKKIPELILRNLVPENLQTTSYQDS